MKTPNQPIDAVATMRKLRDRLSAQMEGMSFEEQKQFIQERLRQRESRIQLEVLDEQTRSARDAPE